MEYAIPQQEILEYARLHGLATDYAKYCHDERDVLHVVSTLLLKDLAKYNDEEALGWLPNISPPIEKFVLNRESQELLAATIAYGHQDLLGSDEFELAQRSKIIKVELPVLSTDHELDIRLAEFRSSLVEPLKHMQAWHVEEEDDEGMTWPSKTMTLPREYNSHSEMERLKLTKEAASILHDVMTAPNNDDESLIGHEFGHRRNVNLSHITPPLSPLPSPILDNSSLNLGVCAALLPLSESTDCEADALTRSFLAKDGVILDEEGRLEWKAHILDSEELVILQTSEGVNEEPPTSPLVHRARKLKVEQPLTPPPTTGLTKHVSWSDELAEMISNVNVLREPSESASDAGLEACFNDIIRVEALQAEQDLIHEELQETDLTQRLLVPDLPFPRKDNLTHQAAHETDEDAEVAEIMLSIAKLKCHHWSVSKIDKMVLWVPFTVAAGSTAVHEEIQDTGLVSKYVDFLSTAETVDMDSLTWKPEGLRILDISDDEEEELIPADHVMNVHDDTTATKEKFLHVTVAEHVASNLGGDIMAHSPLHKQQETYEAWFKPGQLELISRTLPTNLKFDSATDELNHFMQIQTGQVKRRKLAHPTVTRKSPEPETQQHSSIPTIDTHVEPGASTPVNTTLEAFPAPLFMPTATDHPVIVSSTILSERRHLIKNLTRIDPSITIIPRDTHRADGTDHKVRGLADFIISPSTGILTTTLQHIKQKALPGQKDHSLIHERVQALAPLYEKLYVLVTSGRESADDSRAGLGESDSLALTDLISFASGLEDDVVVVFVAGREEDLARWILGLLCSALTEGSREVQILQDETTWEYFLCQAGMNPYAAQAVLSAFKAPLDEDRNGRVQGEVSREYGLIAFMSMSPEERIQKLEGLLGGRKLLQRVSDIVEARWK